MLPVCNISVGSLVISSENRTCGSTALPSQASGIIVTGSSQTNSISIEDAQIVLELDSVSVEVESPIIARSSGVTFITRGSNQFTSTLPGFAALSCTELSNFTFLASEDSSISARSLGFGAGLGTPLNGQCHSLRFLNGTYHAAGTVSGAGIGCGRSAGGDSSIGSIVMEDGHFFASGRNAAGIGSGYSDNGDSTIENLTILAGEFTVNATDGAGIGSGNSLSGTSQIFNILIESGAFNVTGVSGAGIGSGEASAGATLVETLTITGGNFMVRSIGGAGIGAGLADDGTASLTTLIIQGGSFVVTGEAGAGIGAGEAHEGTSHLGNLTVLAGTFAVSGTAAAAGIGAGFSTQMPSMVDSIYIETGQVTATGSNGAGIGAGFADGGLSRVGSIRIENGRFDVSGQDAAGLGAGLAMEKGNSTVSSIVLNGGSFLANGRNGAGIGAGFGNGGSSTVGSLTIAGGEINAHGGADAAGVGAGVAKGGLSAVSNLTIANGSLVVTGISGCGTSSSGVVSLLHFPQDFAVTLDCSVFDRCFGASTIISGEGSLQAITNSPNFLDEGWSRDSDFRAMDFYGQYRNPSFIEDWAARPMIHIRSFAISHSDIYTVTFRFVDFGLNYSVSAEFSSFDVIGIVLTLKYSGAYSIELQGTSGPVQQLCDGKREIFEVGYEETFFEDVAVCQPIPSPSESQLGLILGVSIASGAMLIACVTLFVKIWRTPTPLGSREAHADARASSLDARIYTSDGAF